MDGVTLQATRKRPLETETLGEKKRGGGGKENRREGDIIP